LFLGKIFEIKGKDEILKLYRIYENLIQLTKRIKSFCLLQNFLKDERIQCPEFFEVKDEENQKIELYINSLTTEVSGLYKKCFTCEIPKFGDLNHIVLKEKEDIVYGNKTLKYRSKTIHFEPSSIKNSQLMPYKKDKLPAIKTKFNLPLKKVDSKDKYEEYKEKRFL